MLNEPNVQYDTDVIQYSIHASASNKYEGRNRQREKKEKGKLWIKLADLKPYIVQYAKLSGDNVTAEWILKIPPLHNGQDSVIICTIRRVVGPCLSLPV